jgi:thiol-disulfide isomerase/thioredoxin
MRDAISKTLIPGLKMASIQGLGLGLGLVFGLGLVACGGDGASQSGAEAVAAESPQAQEAPAGDNTAMAAGEVAEASQGDEPIVLSQGEEIDVTDYLDKGKITIFDFYSEYCPPCKRIAPYLLKLHQERDDITVVKVDINRPGVRGIDWRSPVAQQYHLQSIPHFQIYDAQGRLLAEGQQAMGLLQGYMEGRS